MRHSMTKSDGEMAINCGYLCRGYQQITSLSAATGLTVPGPANKGEFALIQAEGADLRFRDDGPDPTATEGMVLANGSTMWYQGDLNTIKFIQASSGGILNVSYYG